ncbi:DUF3108 domain-containing protein [Starkeya koreensis]|uniref:DUF3108 domain-containing protein n=1 Tax=Ancylobacter koreensis TaxID=266121 RepID=A0ABT0DHW3_9HYPH|nr:DUF3108 domain-containing protein [Ancylobacter koreensis]MCK0206672.1 DUF3108 domain-containing protein [Ancylobacter koreensis]
MLRFCLTAVLALGGAGAAMTDARADGRLEARYLMSLGGLELGRAALIIEIDDKSYIASGSGRLTGVAQAVAPGKGTAGARGVMERGAPAPRSFAMQAESDKKAEAIRIVMNASGVTDTRIEPPINPAPDRVPITDKDRKGVLDPMTAALIAVPAGADPFSAKACERVLSIYDGRQRYDLELSFERVEDVKAEKGYSGPSVVCRIAYRPVSGHRPSRSAVKYMMKNRDMFVWLVPVAGTKVMVPFRAAVTTAIGVARLDAESFETEPMIGRRATPSKAGVP